MARTSRRYVFHAANVSLLTAALALPAGMTVSMPESRDPAGSAVAAPAQTTDPPSPPPSPPSDPTDEDTGPSSPPPTTESNDSGVPDDSTDSPPSPTSTSDETPEDSPTSDSGGTDEQTPEDPSDLETESDEVTTSLSEEKEKVPEELAPAVDTLLDIVSALDAPETLPQDREGIIESAENLTTALEVISDPSTPPELRKQLTALVKQVTSTLKTISSPRVPPEERSMLILVVKRTTSVLDVICDPKTPQELRGTLIATVDDTHYALERSPDGTQSDSTDGSQGPDESKGPDQDQSTAMLLGASSEIVRDRRTPPREREKLADITQQVSSLLRKVTDPKTSQEERSEAKKELDERTTHMKEQQEESASAQDRPEESLGKAAALCTSAIFEAAPESSIMRGLKKLVPAQWKDEGVKDFYKAKEKSKDQLDVLAQLRNNEDSRAPFDVVPLVTALAEIVPRDRLFGELSGSALYCQQTASYLDEEFGVTVGTWLT
ncbi:hypothetical protein [Streptomyces sp. 13-12-16]|uniref:hypothetical protein n=1 Tax=Streptomyces sp. 13-12-16 TaxID=1570823 RepID=UPI00117F257B|nr:hypothetical protein [Streptomyces sp. 13-12-16]